MAAPVQKGQILAGKYRVDQVLGEGGMGVVVAATDTQLERKVAIKFLLPEYSQHREASARFMREARAAVKIQSEHIARVIDVNTMDNGSPYMVMEHLEGGDLSQVLEQRGPLPVEDAVSYVIQASDAIAEAHAYGIVHRDLKPANLFLAQQPDGSSKVKVLDFGISKNTLAVKNGIDPSLTRTSSMMGSPLYMSPEQMRSTKDVDFRTDIWALGVILYELLVARPPFDASSIPELSAKILLEEPSPLGRNDVPEDVQDAIARALQKQPQNRFPSVAEFVHAIAPFATRGARANVERISRLLTAAGLSTSQVEMAPTVPPAAASSALGATEVDGARPAATLRDHSATISQWGRTNGPETAPRKTSSSRAIIWGGASVVVVMGVVGAWLWRPWANSNLPVPEPAASALALAPTAISAPVVAPIAPSAAVAATSPAAAPEQVPASHESSNAEAIPAPSTTSTATPVPPAAARAAAPKPVLRQPKPAPSPAKDPTVAKKPTPLKDKFGSRK